MLVGTTADPSRRALFSGPAPALGSQLDLAGAAAEVDLPVDRATADEMCCDPFKASAPSEQQPFDAPTQRVLAHENLTLGQDRAINAPTTRPGVP